MAMMDDGPISTVHIAGFSPDTTEREVYLLLATQPGFSHATMRYPEGGRGPTCFAKFDTPELALQAVQRTDGLNYSVEAGYGPALHAAMATSQLKQTKGVTVVSSNRSTSAQMPMYPGKGGKGGRYQPYGAGDPNGRAAGFRGAQPGMMGMAGMVPMIPSTLFLDTREAGEVTEEDIYTALAAAQPERVTVRGTKVWIKFTTPAEAQLVMSAGALLLRGFQIRLQYARSDSRNPKPEGL